MSDEDELEKIKRRKLMELMRLQKAREEQEKQREQQGNAFEQKVDLLKNFILAPTAKTYLDQIRERNPPAADRIEQMIFPPAVMEKLDLLIYLARQGRIPQGVIPVTEIQYLERQVLGIKSKILVKKRGEDHATDLSSFLTKDRDK